MRWKRRRRRRRKRMQKRRRSEGACGLLWRLRLVLKWFLVSWWEACSRRIQGNWAVLVDDALSDLGASRQTIAILQGYSNHGHTASQFRVRYG